MHSRQYYGADLAFKSDFDYRFHFHLLALFPPCRVWLKNDGFQALPVRVGQLGRCGATTQGESWDLSFVTKPQFMLKFVGLFSMGRISNFRVSKSSFRR